VTPATETETAPRWPRGVPPVHVAVQCQHDVHHVFWRRGALVLEQHDATADAVVVALGGEPPACLEVLRSWRLGYVEQEPPNDAAGLVRSLSSVARWINGDERGQPVVLPEPLRRLREASILHTWGRGLRDDRAGRESEADFLARAVRRRVRDVIERDLRVLGGRVEADVRVEVGDAVDPRRSHGRAGGRRAEIELFVRPSWLTTVWVAGVESWCGGLVLDLDADGADVARWEPDDDGDGKGGLVLVVAREDVR
jgi:hypothetical protein